MVKDMTNSLRMLLVAASQLWCWSAASPDLSWVLQVAGGLLRAVGVAQGGQGRLEGRLEAKLQQQECVKLQVICRAHAIDMQLGICHDGFMCVL